jgi:hypothetical protein
LDFFVQFRLMVSRWSLGHQWEQQHKIRVSPARPPHTIFPSMCAQILFS